MIYISVCFISFIFLFICSMISFFAGLDVLMNDVTLFIEWEVISLNSCSIVMTFLWDWMSLIFMSFVLLISSLVIYYSKEYMGSDYNINRFIMLVLAFVLSMMLLIISPNLISILLGWDGLGLVSYCLVIYFQNVKSYNAGMLTALSNRIGDVAFLLAIAWMLNYGSWNYIFYIEMMKIDFEMGVISVLIVLAAMTKSAQIPFSSWLPAAMAAPTPVSALVHSSTLVTAGIYLLIRFNILISGTFISTILLLLGGLTMFMSGLGANFEFDLKKIIALSTLSQLGLMMSILSMGFPKMAFFHMLTHALFKALLFMCAGAIIHNMSNSQDIRAMGNLSYHMPLTVSCLNTANFALCGLPFLAGFYSKDLILELVSMSYMNMFIYFLYFFSTGLTVCYSFRLVYYILTGDLNVSAMHYLSDEGWVMLRGMLGLMIMSVMGGSMLGWLIFPTPDFIILPFYLKIFTVEVLLIGATVGYLINKVSLYFMNKSLLNYNLSYFCGTMWFMPYISTYGVVNYPLVSGVLMYKSVDQGWSEFFGGQMVYNLLAKYSKMYYLFQNNNFKLYFLSFILWVILFIVIFMFV